MAAPGSGLTVRFASPKRGIEGQVRGAGRSIFFSSRTSNGAVTASIVAQGAVVYEYRELPGEMISVAAGDGSQLALRRPPELRIKGILYGPSSAEQLAALQSLAMSPEGQLIRRLGLELFRAAPGQGLVAERRGLELATQALWPHFLPDGQPAPRLTMDYEVGPHG